MLRFFRNPSSSSSSKNTSLKNCGELSSDKLEQSIHDWTIPEVKTREIYKVGSFNLQTDYLIKTIEKTESVMGNVQSLSYFT